MEKKSVEQELIARVLEGGFVSFPKGLFSEIGRLGLAPEESLLLLQLWFLTYGQGREANEAKLAALLGVEESRVLEILAGLIAKEYVAYEEREGQLSYNLSPLLGILYPLPDSGSEYASESDSGQAYRSFEGEFNRPLSPIEVDFLKEWLEVKGYGLNMVLEALKVAVAGGKLSFTYIDHILIDWEKKGVRSLKENKEYEASRKTPSPTSSEKKKKPKGRGKYEDIYLN